MTTTHRPHFRASVPFALAMFLAFGAYQRRTAGVESAVQVKPSGDLRVAVFSISIPRTTRQPPLAPNRPVALKARLSVHSPCYSPASSLPCFCFSSVPVCGCLLDTCNSSMSVIFFLRYLRRAVALYVLGRCTNWSGRALSS